MWQQTLLKKPILVGGLGICALLWGWDNLQGSWEGLSQWGLWGLSGFGFVLWRLRRSPSEPSNNLPINPLTSESLQQALQKTHKILEQYQAVAPELSLADLDTERQQLQQQSAIAPTNLNGVVLGEKRTGKSALLPHLPATLLRSTGDEILNLNWQEWVLADSDLPLPSALKNSHYVIVLTNGDLTASQWHCLQYLQQNHYPWQLLLSQQDRLPDGDRQTLLQQLQHQVTQLQPTQTVEAISAAPAPLPIRRHLENGDIEYDQEMMPPQLGNLIADLEATLWQQQPTLQYGVIWRQAQHIQQQALERWQANRRMLALPLIEQAQWLTGGAALVNPVANLDLLAAIAINGQLVCDLSQLYHQKVSLAQAQTVARQMGEILVKLGLVELSSQALAGLLKSQPLTYLAGGALQGLSAAYLTRIAGLSLVEFLECQPPSAPKKPWDWQQLSGIMQRTFEQNQRLGVLQSFLQTARQKLAGSTPLIATE